MSNYSKVAGYKVNIQKSITFLYTISKQEEYEIKHTIPFILAHTKVKRIYNLTKYVQDHMRRTTEL